MKILAKIPASLLSRELTVALKLQEQSLIILIPQSLLQKQGVDLNNITFDLIIDKKNKITLMQSNM